MTPYEPKGTPRGLLPFEAEFINGASIICMDCARLCAGYTVIMTAARSSLVWFLTLDRTWTKS